MKIVYDLGSSLRLSVRLNCRFRVYVWIATKFLYVTEFTTERYPLKMVSVTLTIRLQVYAKVLESFSSIGCNILKYILKTYNLFLCYYTKRTKMERVQVPQSFNFLTYVTIDIKVVSILSKMNLCYTMRQLAAPQVAICGT